MKRLILFANALIVLLLIGIPLAFAQSGTTVDQTGWQNFVTYALGVVGALVAGLIGWTLNWARVWIKQKTGLDLDAAMQAQIQTAVKNAAGKALALLGNKLDAPIDVRNPIVKQVVDLVLQWAPAAVEHFGLTPDKIAEMVVAWLPQVANTTTPQPTA